MLLRYRVVVSAVVGDAQPGEIVLLVVILV